jgi:hypothetical protein
MLSMCKIGKAFALLLTVIIAMSFLTLLTVEPVSAQPLWVELGVPTEPINAPPTIQINSPSENQTFDSANVLLNFSVIIPHSWVRNDGPAYPATDTHIWGNITSISFSLDGNPPQNLTFENMNVPYFGNSSQNLNFSAPLALTNGAHFIQVYVSGYTYYCLNPLDSVINPLQLASVPVEANTTVNFYVTSASLSPTVPELSWLVIVPLLVSVFAFAVVLRYRKVTYG